MTAVRSGTRSVAVLAVLAAAALSVAGCDRGDHEGLRLVGTTAPKGTAVPQGTPTTSVTLYPEELASKDAEAVYRRFLVAIRRGVTSGSDGTARLEDVAAGDALETYQNARRWQAKNGLRTAGRFKIVDISIVSTTPTRVGLASCTDTRKSYTVGKDGKTSTPSKSPFVKSSVVVRLIDGRWKVWTIKTAGSSSC